MSDLLYLAGGVAVFLLFAGYAVLLEADLTMLMILIYAVAAVGVAAYMVAALLYPEKF